MQVCKIAPETLFEDQMKKLNLPKDISELPVINNLEDLIQELNKVFESDSVNVDYVTYLMNSYKSNPADWKKYAKFDRFRYTRNLVNSGNGKYNLLALCWGEGHGSSIHDHANAHCFMKMLEGELHEVRFSWPSNLPIDETNAKPLQEIERNILPLNGVCYINDSQGLHRVENPSHTEKAVSLHLYCPPFNQCHMFNQQTGQKTCCNITFWSKYGERRDKTIQDSREPEDN